MLRSRGISLRLWWVCNGMVGNRLWGWCGCRSRNLYDDRLLLLWLLWLAPIGAALILVRLPALTAFSSTAFPPGLAPFPLAGNTWVVPVPVLVLVGLRVGASSLLMPPLPAIIAIIVVTHLVRVPGVLNVVPFGCKPCE